jgi:hypothetical protein
MAATVVVAPWLRPQETFTLPRIDGWISQRYANVPAWVNVWENDLPSARSPESQLPSPAVQVWVTLSLLVVVTLVPTVTRRTAGEKAKFSIVICAVGRGAVVVVVGAFVVGGDVVADAAVVEGGGGGWVAAVADVATTEVDEASTVDAADDVGELEDVEDVEELPEVDELETEATVSVVSSSDEQAAATSVSSARSTTHRRRSPSTPVISSPPPVTGRPP